MSLPPAAPPIRQWQTDGRAIALAGIAVLASIVCGRIAASHYATHLIAAILLLPILVAVAKRPAVNVILLLIVVASVFSYGGLPRIGLPGDPPINAGDLLLMTSIGGTLWRRPFRSWPPVARRYFWALLLTLLLATVATIKVAMLGPDQAREALFAYRNFLYLGVALTIALELSQDEWLTLLNAAMLCGATIAAISIVATASSRVATGLTALSGNAAAPSVEAISSSGVTRVRLPGLFFVYSMCIMTLVSALLIHDRWRSVRIFALVLMLGAIGVSLNRDMYAGLAVGVAVTAILGEPRTRRSLGRVAFAAVCVALLISLTSPGTTATSGVGARASTLLAPTQVAASSSLQDRAYEYSKALPAIAAHPWFGVGPRQFYGAYLGQGEVRAIRFFVQNLYVDFATDYGVPTTLMFLLLSAICLCFGLSRIRRAEHSLDRALLAAAIGTLVALLLSCLVGTFVQSPESTVAFGAACGFLMAAGLRTYPDVARRQMQISTSK